MRSPAGDERMEHRSHPAFHLYLALMIPAGLLIIVHSLFRVFSAPTGHQWLLLAGLALLTSSLCIKIPGVNSKISIGDTFFFTNVILYGPAAGVLTAAMEALLSSLRARTASRRLQYSLFNISIFSVSAFVSGTAFFALLGRGPFSTGETPGFLSIVSPIGVLALVHYIANSGSVAAVIALETRKNLFRIWKECYLWTSITYFAGALAGGLIAVNVRTVRLEVIGVIAPVVVALYYTYRVYLEKVLELNRLYISTVESLAMAIDAKDQLSHGHIRRVQVFARGLAKAMGVQDEEALRWIEAAALLHDIGKLAVPDYILNKPGRLTQTEFKKVMIHPAVGGDILSSIHFPYDVSRDVRHHHENWDGTGYPDGLKGRAISLGARILSVVDAFDAMTSDRPYRAAMSQGEALAVLESKAGSLYDPEVVRCFGTIHDSLTKEASEIQERERGSRPESRVEPGSAGEDQGAAPRHREVFQNIVATHREVSAMFDLAQTLGSTLHLEETLTLVASKVGRLIPFTTCVIYLHSTDKGVLTAAHVSGASAEAFKGYTMECGKNLSGWVAAHNHPAINADPVYDLLPLRPRLQVELKNSLVYPLHADGECYGVLSLYAAGGLAFSDDHVRIMEVVSGQAARAIRNAIKYEETQVDALTDRLTSLPNSRYLDTYFEREIEKAQRFRFPVSVIAMDLDRFKQVNDVHGHHLGDLMLLEVAKVLNRTVRASDLVVRYGGDEFIAVASQTSAEDARSLGRRVQREVEGIRLGLEGGACATIGISVGVATFPEDGAALHTLLQKADQAMYQNKEQRRIAAGAPKRSLELVTARPA